MIMGSACRLMNISMYLCTICTLVVLGFNDTSTLVGYFVSSSSEREKRDRRNIREDEGGVGGGGEGGGGDKSYRTPSPHPTTPINTCTLWWHNCFVYGSKVGIII